jgi:pyrimidine-nucleoside phosphorylase
MIVKLLLDRKREGGELAPEEIRALVEAYTHGDVPDYQMAAFAMAVCCRGMTAAETHALTDAMQHSGECLTWPGPSADKHSTGGIGDKLSLVIQPLAASCGLSVPSLAGRGLGLTGGTVDKLESIPGYNACLPLDDFRRVVASCGVSIAAQTAEIAPADKKLYALRDVTGTVPSIPLIVGSILSKKLAEGADTLVFDVKCGSGAFMKTRADACALARALVDGAKAAGRKAAALVTAMDEPLGRTVGNALEVEEAIAVLKGAVVPSDVIDLSVELAARMVSLEKGMALNEALAACRANLANGAAYARFAEMVKLHGGDLEAFAARPRGETRVVASPRAGYVARVDAEGIAQAAFELGAGRAKADDVLDFAAGVTLAVARGDRVEAGQPLAELAVCDRPAKLPVAEQLVRAAVTFADEPPASRPLILESLS